MKELSISQIDKINIFGRTGKLLDPLPLLFNGSGIEITLTGSDLWVSISSDSDFHEPWIAYELNGALMGRQMLLPGEHEICLFRNMNPETPKTVRFYRELQAMSEDDKCKVLVKGIKFDGELLDPPLYERRIEFIGDSITSGEGTYGALPDVDWLAMYMSASKNYATMTANALNAKFQILSQGGWGVCSGWDNDIRHNIPSVYEKVCGLAGGKMNEEMGTQEEYDFSFNPDAIVVNLGTNDATGFNQPPFTNPDTGEATKLYLNEDGSHNREDILKIENAIVDFLCMLRKHNKKAHIVWCYGMLGYDLSNGITEAINKYRSDYNDHNVAYLQLPNTTMERLGAHMHPGVKSHEIASEVLVDYLKNKLNW